MRAIIIDLDGTLCNVSHRVHHIQKEPKDWPAFFDACIDDTPNEAVTALVMMAIMSRHTILYVSGRPETHRHQTEVWLTQHGLDYHTRLLMRAEGDYRPDVEVKRELYEQHIKDRYDVLFTVDDRGVVVRMWRDLGLVCFQVAEGNF